MSGASVGIEELARKLKMSKTTIYKLIHARKIPAVKKGNKWEIDKKGITQWLGMKMGEFSTDDLSHIERDDKEAVIEITPLIKEENVLFNLFPARKNYVIDMLIEVMAKNYDLKASEKSKIRVAIIERERLCSTAIGEGVAIPHPRSAVITRVRKPMIVLGICRQGLDFESIDGNPTHLIFLVSAPRDDIHLKLMARLSRILRDKATRYKLTHSKNYKEFIEILEKREKNL